jgi:uncharacterized membrane protein
MANTFNLGNGNWAQKTEKLLAYNAENDNFKPLPFDFDRGSTATRVNRDGLIETVGVDEPRIDFLNNTKGHLLLEPSRTNLITDSEDLSEWNIARATLEADAITSPDGRLTYKLKESTDTGSHPLYFQGITVSASLSHTMSIFVKAAGRSIFRINLTNGGSATYFDLSTEAVTSGTGNIENYGNGWYRCSTTFTTSGTNQEVYIEPVISGTTQSYTGDGTSGIYLYGAQIEQGSYATSYIPTSGSTATRSAETTSQTVPDGVIGQTEGTIFVDFNQKLINQNTTRRIIALTDGSSTNRIVFYITAQNKIEYYIRNSSGNLFLGQSTTDYGNSVGSHKIAATYKDGDYALFMDGNLIISGTGTSGTIPACNRIDVGNQLGASNLFEPINDVKLYNTRLSNSELAALTT